MAGTFFSATKISIIRVLYNCYANSYWAKNLGPQKNLIYTYLFLMELYGTIFFLTGCQVMMMMMQMTIVIGIPKQWDQRQNYYNQKWYWNNEKNCCCLVNFMFFFRFLDPYSLSLYISYINICVLYKTHTHYLSLCVCVCVQIFTQPGNTTWKVSFTIYYI